MTERRCDNCHQPNPDIRWVDVAGGLSICGECRARHPQFNAPELVASGQQVAVITRASQVQIRSVKWLWRPWLPLGKVTLLAGAPGQGKSQLTAFMAAHTTTNTFEPSNLTRAGNAVILTAEDDLDDTVVPRLIAVGADLDRVEFINMRRSLPSGLTAEGLIKLPGDIATLHSRLVTGDVRLVILDPVASFVGREHSTYINQDVRDLLDPVVALARAYMVAIVIVLHLNKSEAKSWAGKIAESHGFQAVARTVLALAPDPDDEDGEYGDEKVLAATKLNLVRRMVPAVRFKVRGSTVYDTNDEPVETSMLELNGTMNVYADDLLAEVADRSARRDAIEFLINTLANGPMESKALKKAARDYGISWRTIERCYREVCMPAKPSRPRGSWVYGLSPPFLTSGEDGMPNHGGHGGHTPKSAMSANFPYTKSAKVNESNGLRAARERDRRLGERWEEDE